MECQLEQVGSVHRKAWRKEEVLGAPLRQCATCGLDTKSTTALGPGHPYDPLERSSLPLCLELSDHSPREAGDLGLSETCDNFLNCPCPRRKWRQFGSCRMNQHGVTQQKHPCISAGVPTYAFHQRRRFPRRARVERLQPA